MSDFTDVVEVGVPGPPGPEGPEGPPGSGGGGGAVDSVNDDGTTTDVDNTDPANPVVSVRDGVFDADGAATDAVADHNAADDPHGDRAYAEGLAEALAIVDGLLDDRLEVLEALDPVLEGDPRLDDDRDPTAHATSHQDGGSDELALDGSQITSGTVAEPRIASTIARDSEVTTAVANEASARDAAIATAIANLIASAPGALDTIDELAAALGDDPNFATTITNALAGKASTSHAATHKGGGSDAIDVATTLLAGLMAAADKSKLDGIEAGATADQTAAEILAALLTIDGSGSGLDADLLDGNNSSAFETPAGAQAKADAKVSDTAYDATLWNGVTGTAPSKNAVRDALEALIPSVADDSITNAKLANMANATVKGRNTAGTGDPEDVTMPQLRTLLALAVGDVTGAAPLASPTFTGTVTLPTGASGAAPLNIPAGTLETTPNDGDIEMDANALYGCTDAGNRGVIPVEHYIRQHADRAAFGNNTNQQAIFDSVANGTLTLETGYYEFETLVQVKGMSGTSGNLKFSLIGAGSATLASILWMGGGIDQLNDSTPLNWSGISEIIATQTATNLSTGGTNTVETFLVKGSFEVTAAGTLIPSVAQTTATTTAVTVAGSYFKCSRKGATTMVSVGQWS